MLRPVDDGYLRLTLPDFHALQFRLHMCLQDADLLRDLWGEGIPAVKAGYYELVCDDTQPIASIGCAWHLAVGSVQVCVGDADISSNVMLLNANGAEVGAQNSRIVIRRWLCAGPRKEEFQSAVLHEAGQI
jgi:hypothetical protein